MLDHFSHSVQFICIHEHTHTHTHTEYCQGQCITSPTNWLQRLQWGRKHPEVNRRNQKNAIYLMASKDKHPTLTCRSCKSLISNFSQSQTWCRRDTWARVFSVLLTLLAWIKKLTAWNSKGVHVISVSVSHLQRRLQGRGVHGVAHLKMAEFQII